jgi:hypothetical protein
MALPGSGPLSLGQIRDEQVTYGGFSSTYSLRQLSSNAGKTTPDSVSEFYGYSALTFTYYATWALDDPCDYNYLDIVLGSDGKYYIDSGGYTLVYDYSPASSWYEYLYYEPLFPANIYKEWVINAASTVFADGGNIASGC